MDLTAVDPLTASLVQLAAGGAAIAALGAFWLVRPAAYARVCAALASPPPGPREARRLPAAMIAVGAAWLTIAAAEVFPYPHGQRPYPVTALVVLLMILSAPAAVALVLWLAAARRFLVRG